jgi:hypothetical protein
MIAGYGILAVAALIVAMALRMPTAGFRFESRGASAITASVSGLPARILDAHLRVRFTNRIGTVAFPAGELLADFEPDGGPRRIAEWYAAHDRLSRMVRAGGVEGHLGGGAPVPLRA